MGSQRLQKTFLILGAVASFAAAFFVLAWAGLPSRADYSGQEFGEIGYAAPEIGAIAPPFRLESLEAKAVELISLRGAPVIINFWATWCVPCQIEMPELQSLYEETGTRVLAVNIAEAPEIVVDWVADYGLGFDILLDPNQEVYAAYRLRGQPTTFVLDADGIIRQIFYGATNADALRAALESLENG